MTLDEGECAILVVLRIQLEGGDACAPDGGVFGLCRDRGLDDAKRTPPCRNRAEDDLSYLRLCVDAISSTIYTL